MKVNVNESEIDSSENKEKEPVIEEVAEETKPMLDYSNIKSSKDIDVPPLLIDQVIGHEESIETIKKAAKQRRNVLLIGDPGVGKSMLAKGMAQILPHETLQDVLIYPNAEDSNHPLIRTVPAGEGKKIVQATKASSKGYEEKKNLLTMFAIGAVIVIGFMYGTIYDLGAMVYIGDPGSIALYSILMVILIWFELVETSLTRTRGRREYAGEAWAERGRSGAESKANKPISLGSEIPSSTITHQNRQSNKISNWQTKTKRAFLKKALFLIF